MDINGNLFRLWFTMPPMSTERKMTTILCWPFWVILVVTQTIVGRVNYLLWPSLKRHVHLHIHLKGIKYFAGMSVCLGGKIGYLTRGGFYRHKMNCQLTASELDLKLSLLAHCQCQLRSEGSDFHKWPQNIASHWNIMLASNNYSTPPIDIFFAATQSY